MLILTHINISIKSYFPDLIKTDFFFNFGESWDWSNLCLFGCLSERRRGWFSIFKTMFSLNKNKLIKYQNFVFIKWEINEIWKVIIQFYLCGFSLSTKIELRNQFNERFEITFTKPFKHAFIENNRNKILGQWVTHYLILNWFDDLYRQSKISNCIDSQHSPLLCCCLTMTQSS